MGFLFWRAVHVYGIEPSVMLAMPIRLFWSLCTHVDRIRAERDLSLLDVMSVAQSGSQEAHNSFRASLTERLGTPVRREQAKSSRDDILSLMVRANK